MNWKVVLPAALRILLGVAGFIFILSGLFLPTQVFGFLANLYWQGGKPPAFYDWQQKASLLLVGFGLGFLIVALLWRRLLFPFFFVVHKLDALGYRKAALVLFSLALILRLIWVFTITTTPLSDAADYDRCAQSLVKYGTYCHPPSVWRPPGTSLLAAPFYFLGLGRTPLFVFYAFLGALTVLLVGQLAKRFLSDKTAILAMLIFTFWPSHIAYSKLVLSELPSMVLVLLSVDLALRITNNTDLKKSIGIAICSGICLGISTLFRTTFSLFPVLYFAIWLLHRIPIKKALILLIVLLFAWYLPPEPWRIRNYFLCGKHNIANILGTNLFLGNNDKVKGAMAVDGIPKNLQQIKDTIKREQAYVNAAIDWIISHPYKFFIELPPRKLYVFLSRDSYAIRMIKNGGILSHASSIQTKILTVLQILNELYYFTLVLLPGLLGWILLLIRKYKNLYVQFLSLWILYFLAITVVFYGGSRYHYAITPVLVIFSAAILIQSDTKFQLTRS